MTPEQYASAYLEKHGMIPQHDFVPSTAVDKATILYTTFVTDDCGLILDDVAKALTEVLTDLPRPLSGPSRPCTDEDRYDGGWYDRWNDRWDG